MKRKIHLFILSLLTVFAFSLLLAHKQTVLAESTQDDLTGILTSYYNNGFYTKDTVINVDVDKFSEDVGSVEGAASFFHAGFVPSLTRRTVYSPGKLVMTTDEDIAGVGYKDVENGMVRFHGVDENVDFTVDNTNVEDYYVTLLDFKNSVVTSQYGTTILDAIWEESNGVYSTTDADVLDAFRLFTAPMWLGKTAANANYVIYTKATIEESNCNLIMKLWVSKINSGLLIDNTENDGTNYVFSQANISSTTKLYFSPGVWSENDATFGIRVWNDEKEEIFRPVALGESGYYEIEYSVGMNNVEFVRYDSTNSVWWNGSPELEIPSNKNLFVITSWQSYLWDEYLTNDTAGQFIEGDALYVQLNGDWISAASASKFICQFYGYSGDTDFIVLECVDSFNYIYKVMIPDGKRHAVRFGQVNPSNIYDVWNVTDYILCDNDAKTNLIVLDSGWSGMKGYWNGSFNEPYVDVKDMEEDYSFEFSSNLEETNSIYPISSGRTYYVSSDGNDNNNGLTPSTPLKSFSGVSKLNLVAGDSVLFKKGDIFNGTLSLTNLKGQSDNPITFASYGDSKEKPILTNTTSLATQGVLTLVNSSNVVIRDLEFHVYGLDRKITGGSVCATGINVQYNFVGSNKYEGIYICDNVLVGKTVDNTYEDYDTNASGIVFMSLEQTHDSSPLEMFEQAYICNNQVSYFGRVGIQCGGWIQESGGQNEMHRNKYIDLHFDNNVVHHIGGIGMYISAAAYSTMDRNHIYQTGITTDEVMIEGQCGMMYLSAEHCTAKYNVIYDCYDANTGWDAMGIDIDWNTNYIDVLYNYIYNCEGSGIGTMANQNCSIKYNRIENCRGETNHAGSITISNFTNRQYPIPADFHSVTNLLIEGNLVLHSEIEIPVFYVYEDIGDKNYFGNQFINNRVVYVGDESPLDLVWINVETTLNWYKFERNKYYSTDNSQFIAFDSTPLTHINSSDGANIFKPSDNNEFSAWQVRDLNSTYQIINNYIPAKPENCNVTFDGKILYFTWDNSEQEMVWHYNIYKVKNGESPSYLNMIGQVSEMSFEYTVSSNEEYYYVILPESNEGIYGSAVKIKVDLQK